MNGWFFRYVLKWIGNKKVPPNGSVMGSTGGDVGNARRGGFWNKKNLPSLKTNSPHLILDGWKMTFILGWKAYFQVFFPRCYFQEGYNFSVSLIISNFFTESLSDLFHTIHRYSLGFKNYVVENTWSESIWEPFFPGNFHTSHLHQDPRMWSNHILQAQQVSQGMLPEATSPGSLEEKLCLFFFRGSKILVLKSEYLLLNIHWNICWKYLLNIPMNIHWSLNLHIIHWIFNDYLTLNL